MEQWRAGLRVSEDLALEPRDLRLDTDRPTLRIRESKGGENPVKCPCILSCGLLVDVSRTAASRWVQLAAKRAIDAGQLDRGLLHTSALTRCGTATPVTCC